MKTEEMSVQNRIKMICLFCGEERVITKLIKRMIIKNVNHIMKLKIDRGKIEKIEVI